MTGVARSRGRSLVSGSKLGRYAVGERLARGGMAEVYLATMTGIGGFSKPVALKLILPAFADDPMFRRMFVAEARLSAQLDHANIAQVIDVGEADGELFIALEYVHGQTVGSILRRAEDPPPLPVALHLARQISAALAYAHALRTPDGVVEVVHRDVSPSNVMVRYDGGVKLLDFGIAKASSSTRVTRSGMLKGKGGYMAPEQCLGLAVDARADIFAVGILLFELTTRRRLFHGENDYEVMNRIVEGRFTRPAKLHPGYPAVLERIVMRALARKPEDRYPSIDALAHDLDAAANALGVAPTQEAVADYLRGVFGDPPPLFTPVPEAEPVVPSEAIPRSTTRSRRAPRLGLVVAAAIGGAALGATALYLARPTAAASGSESGAPRTPADADAPAHAVDEEAGPVDPLPQPGAPSHEAPEPQPGAAVVPSAAPPGPAGTVEPDPAGVPEEPTATDPVTADADPPAGARERRKSRRKNANKNKSRGKGKGKGEAKTKSDGGRGPLFPWEK